MVFAVVSDDVRREMDRSGLTRLVGEDAYYLTVGEVINGDCHSRSRKPRL